MRISLTREKYVITSYSIHYTKLYEDGRTMKGFHPRKTCGTKMAGELPSWKSPRLVAFLSPYFPKGQWGKVQVGQPLHWPPRLSLARSARVMGMPASTRGRRRSKAVVLK